MTGYRRFKRPGATYFFTVSLEDRSSDLLMEEIDLFRQAYQQTWSERPFRTDAVVVLPDHVHAVWTLPAGDAAFSTRWRLIKARFTRLLVGKMGAEHPSYVSASKRRKGERGIWQRRFWEHCIRDQADFDAHVRYCWGNPVKHGLVAHPLDWVHSSVHRDVRYGVLGVELGGAVDRAFGERRVG